jgi:hypothetical protein
MRHRLLAATAALALLAGPASATIIFNTGNLGGGLEGLVLPSTDDGTDPLLTATVGAADTPVFVSSDQAIDSAGQRVVASDGGTLDFLTLSLANGFGAGSFVFNLNSLGAGGSVILTAVDQFDNIFTSSAFQLSSGQNFFNLTTSGGEFIKRVSLSSTPLDDVRQIRFGDVVAVPAGVVPEPAAWALMILGLGATGALIRRQRRRENLFA